MARVGEHFAEGWQKAKAGGKEYSDAIRNQGNSAREIANKQVEQSRPVQDKPQVSTDKPAASTEHAVQAQKPAVAQQVADKQAARDAAREYVQAKDQARGLNQLTGSAVVNKGADVAIKQPVVNVTQAQDAFVQNQNEPRQAMVAAQAAQLKAQPKATPASKTHDASRSRPEDRAGTRDSGKAADVNKAQDPAQAQRSGLVKGDAGMLAGVRIEKPAVVDGPRDWESEDGIEDEGAPKDRNSSTFAVGSKSRSTGRELGALLGGSSGEADSEAGTEGEPRYAIDLTRSEKLDSPELPESDPAFAVYSEFDSEKVGPETYKAKHQLLERHVLKKLSEIEMLDRSLDAEIKSAFENTPLSRRIIGDIDIEVGKFTGSVYGEGMISG